MKGGTGWAAAQELDDALDQISDLSQLLDRANEVLPRHIGFDHGVVCVTRPELHGGYDWRAPGLPPGWFGRYAEMADHDFVRASVLRRPNVVLRDGDMLSHDDLKRSFVYGRSRELGMGLERVMSVALLDRSADWHGGLTLYRVENHPFSEVESNALQSMVPVLRGSIRMLQRLRRLEERLLARDALYTCARVEAIFFRHLAVEDDRTVGATDLLRHYFTDAEMGPRLLPVALLERLRKRWIASSHTGVSPPELRERDGRLLRISYVPLSSTLVDWRWAILLEELPSDTHLPEWWIDKLTARERQVVALVIQEHDNAFIADALGCTVGTVKKHLQHIFDKLGVDHRHMLVNQARRHR